MKRILSILMSMALIASLLVSMSVTSFAVAEKENEVGTDMATVETTVVSVDATEFANSGKTLEDGTYGWLITTTIDFHEEQAPNILLHDDGLTVSGRLVDALSFEYNLSEAVIYSKRSGMSTTTYAFMNETAVSGMLGAVEQKQYITHDFSANTAPEKFPYKEALEGTVNPDGTPQTKLTHSVYLATTTESFEMDVKVTILTSALTGDLDNPVATIDTVAPEYWERGIVVGEVEPVTYEITFKNEGSDTVLNAGNTTYEEKATVTAPAEPTEPANADPAYNYTFAGWSDGENVYASNEIPAATADVTYTATFNEVKKKVTATFVVEGKANVTETVEYGGTPTAAGVDTTVEGKNFTGWSPALGSITADTTYTAQFAIKTYTITFNVNGATTTKTVNHGETPDFGSVPEKDGYNFTGWSLTENGPVIEGGIPAATGAATYYAVFEEKAAVQYTITFKVDGQADVVLTVNAGTKPEYPNGTPSKDGYRFTVWDSEIVEATADATYVAQFEEIGPAISNVNVVNIVTTHEDILPGAGVVEVTANTLAGKEVKVKADELLRVHTTFDYNSENGTLVEMGMLFVPVNVIGEGLSMEEVVASGKTKDANCDSLPENITTSSTSIVFKAGLVGVPKKGIDIYAVPYYRLSGSERTYHDMQTITFE